MKALLSWPPTITWIQYQATNRQKSLVCYVLRLEFTTKKWTSYIMANYVQVQFGKVHHYVTFVITTDPSIFLSSLLSLNCHLKQILTKISLFSQSSVIVSLSLNCSSALSSHFACGLLPSPDCYRCYPQFILFHSTCHTYCCFFMHLLHLRNIPLHNTIQKYFHCPNTVCASYYSIFSLFIPYISSINLLLRLTCHTSSRPN